MKRSVNHIEGRSDLFAGNGLAALRGQKLHATPIKRVLDADTRQVVGWLYRWNTGHLSVMWKGERCENFVYE